VDLPLHLFYYLVMDIPTLLGELHTIVLHCSYLNNSYLYRLVVAQKYRNPSDTSDFHQLFI